MEEFGLTPEDYAADVIEVYPDNVQSWNVFVAISTQWFTGMGGPIGLRYEALSEVWRRTKTPPQDRDGVFEDLRVMEDAALEAMRKE